MADLYKPNDLINIMTKALGIEHQAVAKIVITLRYDSEPRIEVLSVHHDDQPLKIGIQEVADVVADAVDIKAKAP